MRRSAGRETRGQDCAACGEFVSSQSKFCSRCGLETNRASGGGGPTATFAILGFFVLSGLVIAVWSVAWPGDFNLAYGPAGSAVISPPEGTATMESVDPRAVADNLFNHVVDAAAAGDSTQLHAFLPLALMAYAEAAPLDADGLFHLSTLQRIGEMPTESLASARGILDVEPDHLLGLGAAATASISLGRPDEAADFYSRFVAVYEDEVDRTRTEYIGHSNFLTRTESDALDYLGLR